MVTTAVQACEKQGDFDYWSTIGVIESCFRVTFCHRRVRNGRNREGSFGNGAAENHYRIILFGNGRDRLESPGVGSTPGHPKFRPYFIGLFVVINSFF